ncbi:MAG: hemolysin family protein [Bacteroidaceae bacterium]|nr:hemolysin family protein [Bacteroidaceae bacterium]
MSNYLIILIIAIVLSALFSGMEIAFVSADKMRFEVELEKGDFSASILSRFFKKPLNYISTILVGNNIALVVFSAMLSRIMENLFPDFYHTTNTFLMALIDTVIGTMFVIVFGEYLPKMLFRIKSNTMLNLFAVPILFFYVILYPISCFSMWLSKIMLKTVGANIPEKIGEQTFTKVDLDHFIQSSVQVSEDDADGTETSANQAEVKIFQNILEFSNVKVRDCMIPRNEVVYVDRKTSIEQLKVLFVNSGLSKLLVCDGDIDNVAGYIHSSELFRNKDNWADHIQSIPFVAETMPARKLMKKLQGMKKTLAVVIDEFGGVAGIVSLEDLVEEILGDIQDEHDKNKLVAVKEADGYLLSGRMEISHVNELFSLNIPESEDYLTIGGLILAEAKGFPKVNDIVSINDYRFRIEKMGKTKIELVKLLD